MINLSALLISGNLTTTDLIGNAVRLLLLNPGELAKLKADPGLINQVVEETLRYEPPVDSTARIASADMEVAGTPVKATRILLFHLRAANRDPEAFDEPDRASTSAPSAARTCWPSAAAPTSASAPRCRAAGAPQVALLRLFERFPTPPPRRPRRPACRGARCRSFRGPRAGWSWWTWQALLAPLCIPAHAGD